jgi:hypothetical protein
VDAFLFSVKRSLPQQKHITSEINIQDNINHIAMPVPVREKALFNSLRIGYTLHQKFNLS